MAKNQKYYDLKDRVDGEREAVSNFGANSWLLKTRRLSSGTHEVSFNLFRQNQRLAAPIEKAILKYETEALDLRLIVGKETDPEKITVIQKRLKELEDLILDLSRRLEDARERVGDSFSILIEVS